MGGVAGVQLNDSLTDNMRWDERHIHLVILRSGFLLDARGSLASRNRASQTNLIRTLAPLCGNSVTLGRVTCFVPLFHDSIRVKGPGRGEGPATRLRGSDSSAEPRARRETHATCVSVGEKFSVNNPRSTPRRVTTASGDGAVRSCSAPTAPRHNFRWKGNVRFYNPVECSDKCQHPLSEKVLGSQELNLIRRRG